MHNELALVLDPSIYRALDSSASYPLKERSRFLDMCKSANAPSLLNGTTAAKTTSANTPARTINTAYLNFFLLFWWEQTTGGSTYWDERALTRPTQHGK